MKEFEDTDIYKLLDWVNKTFPYTLTRWIQNNQRFRDYDSSTSTVKGEEKE